MTIVGAATAGSLTALLCPPAIRRLERRAVIDVPMARSSHAVPTPRGGGAALAIGAVVGAVLAAEVGPGPMLGISATALAFGALGLREDLVGVAPLARLSIQAVLAAVSAAFLLGGDGLPLPAGVLWALGCVWLVAFVNAFNFMDGINGISAVQAILSGGAWALVGAWRDEVILVAAGSVVASGALAFLPFNFPRARVFLGDVGSYFLGGWLAAMVVVGVTSGLTVEMAFAPVLLYLVDSGTTLLRRAARRAPLTEPHRDHVYQRLVIGGWSHAHTTMVVASVIIVCSVLGAATMAGDVVVRALADGLLGAVLVGYLALPRWQRRRRRRLVPVVGGSR